MNKHICQKWAIYFLALLIISISMVNCASNDGGNSANKKTSVKNVSKQVRKLPFPVPLDADVENEKREAQKLIDGGISFKNTMSTHGTVSDKGFEYSSNEFDSSDGVELTLQAQLYNSPEELNQAFEKSLAEAKKVFETRENKDGERRFDGANEDNALVVFVSGSFLYTVFSPSVRHLIAFELKEPGYFGGS